MNLLYSDAEQEKNSWEYTSDVGYIPKPTGGGGNEEKDREQDEKIEENAQAIAGTRCPWVRERKMTMRKLIGNNSLK